MARLPWRFVVVTDVGVDSKRPVRVERGRAAEWLRSVGAGADLTPSAGRPAMRLELDAAEAFAPATLSTRLAAHGSGRTEGGAATTAASDLDSLLHDPSFQRVESAWRGLELLLEHAQDAVEVHAVSIPRRELGARFRDAVYDWGLEQDVPPALILVDADFSHRPAELALLRELASQADALQAPLVAGAAAAFFDLRFLVQATSLPHLLSRLATPAHGGWQAFQAEDAARWVTLTLGRYLQREPHADAGGYTETVAESNPDSFLWGRGGWLVAAAAARSVRDHGHPLALSGAQGGRFEKMATRPFPRAANESVALATEAPIAETQVMELSRAAFTPVVGVLRAQVVILPTVVTVYRRGPGKLTVEGTLAYQMMAARLAQRCGEELNAFSGDATELASRLTTGLTEELGTLARPRPVAEGDPPATPVEPVSTEIRAAEGDRPTIVEVRVRPGVSLEGKPAEFAFALPVREV